ncbi:MAG TPA: SIMPL domain-containing protein [Gemmatimonadaceae bacterium]|nr:SIMPL domain-containing protein [Gemmatimonadaceae bacterium]
MNRLIAGTFGLCAFLTVPLAAQDQARPTTPQIVTNASGEVRVTPDRATVQIGVQTRATTAAAASSQNSQKQRAIIDAIKARGIPAEQIATSNFNVIPETRYDREGQAAPRTTSYLVINTITVEVRRIDQVGPVIDAALGAGANQINSLAFGVSNPDSARRAALAIAVAKSRADAEVIARAAGGTLGSLIEINAVDGYTPAPPRPFMAREAMAADAKVPVEPGQESVTATVSARWQFVSGQR